MNTFRSIPIVAIAAATLLLVVWLSWQSSAKSLYADHAYPVEVAAR